MIGLAASSAVWVAATLLHVQASRAIIRRLPREWREHPEAGPGYAALLEGEVSYLKPIVDLLPRLVAVVACFVALNALDVIVAVQAGAAVAGGAWWAWTVRAADRARVKEFAEREGLTLPSHARLRRLAFVAG